MTKKKSKTPMTIDAASRIQSKEAKDNGGRIDKESFQARALRASAKNKDN